MPKDPRSCSLLSPKTRGNFCRPYPSNARGLSQGSSSKDGEESRKEWDESTCPICMEYPHNAVLLICSSHDKGCRPYMCDTSYRHSNCLDQYRKAKIVNDKISERHSELSVESVTGLPVIHGIPLEETFDEMQSRPLGSTFRIPFGRVDEGDPSEPPAMQDRLSEGVVERGVVRAPSVLGLDRAIDGEFPNDLVARIGSSLEDGRPVGGASASVPTSEVANLLCPLCRGKVFGWKVVEPARHQLNRKPRGCAQEGCTFTGTYKELREHARSVHPLARPSDIDPVRQRDWRRLERQRDLGDVLSTIRSAMPGATVLGDYVIDDDEEDLEDEGDDIDFPGDDGNWWTVFLLFQVFGPAAPFAGGRGLPGRMSRVTRGPSGSPLMRSALWGENFQGNGIGGGISSLNGSSINVEGSIGGSTRRRRRSRPRSRGDIS